MTEQWTSVPGWEGAYEVSDLGRVRSVDRLVVSAFYPRGRRFCGRVLKPCQRGGYPSVGLWDQGRYSFRLVHQLVLEAFVGPRPPGCEVRHLNGNPQDNRVANLRWGSSSDNNHDQVRHGTHNNARKTHCKWGHEFTEANTIVTPTGRNCRECYRIQHRRPLTPSQKARKLELQRIRRAAAQEVTS